MSSYVRFNCVGFLLPSRNHSLDNVLLCTPTQKKRWILSVSVSQCSATYALKHKLSGLAKKNIFDIGLKDFVRH